jgi:hypothetical protein
MGENPPVPPGSMVIVFTDPGLVGRGAFKDRSLTLPKQAEPIMFRPGTLPISARPASFRVLEFSSRTRSPP